MSYSKNQVPDAPLPVSMLPRATAPTQNDLLYLVQPGNVPGQRSKSLTLETLVDSDVLGKVIENKRVGAFYPDAGGSADLPYTGVFADDKVDFVTISDVRPGEVVLFNLQATNLTATTTGTALYVSIVTEFDDGYTVSYLSGINVNPSYIAGTSSFQEPLREWETVYSNPRFSRTPITGQPAPCNRTITISATRIASDTPARWYVGARDIQFLWADYESERVWSIT